jgi:asparagine synthase (glutamine-hydrolysing)
MCGIAGVVSKEELRGLKILKILREAHETRGPDGEGSFSDDSLGVFFFQKRLAIIGQEINAHQPITSWDGASTLNFNGEIYNWKELAILIGPDSEKILESGSDARLLVEGLNKFGVDAFLPKIRGMFAFAFLKANKLTLARDRFGQKPLKYAFNKDLLVFGSETTTIEQSLASLGFCPTLDVDSIQHFIGTGYFPPGSTHRCEIKDLLPGSLIEILIGNKTLSLSNSRSWIIASHEKTKIEVEEALELAIGEQLIADAPVGLFMSGGIDSSLIAAISKKKFDFAGPIITMGFPERETLDETSQAKLIAKELGLELISFPMTGIEALQTFEEMMALDVEPLGDPSILPTMYLSKCMAQRCKVVLTGDGADESFFGYDRYIEMNVIHFEGATNYSGLTPLQKVKKFMKKLSLRRSSNNLDDFAQNYFARQFPQDNWESLFIEPRKIEEKVIGIWKNKALKNSMGLLRLQDFRSYLPQNILVKTDRSTMAYGLEGRMPFLDERVHSVAMQGRFDELVQKGIGKFALKKILADHYLGDELVFRSKRGFSPPLDLWLRNELKPATGKLIADADWLQVGVDPISVLRYWEEFQSGNNSGAWRIWVLLQASRLLKEKNNVSSV